VQDDILRGTDALRDFGGYAVCVNALMTDSVTPEVASRYGIMRGNDRALLTISVHRTLSGAGPAH
jgi:hypothetical protein